MKDTKRAYCQDDRWCAQRRLTRRFPRGIGMFVLLLTLIPLLAGCRQRAAPLSENARQIRAVQSRLSVGMSEQQVAAAIGMPTVFRRRGGRWGDVAIYQFKEGRITVYFYGGRLTRARSVRPPVNR